MTGIRFQSWESFLHYMQKREGIVQGIEWNSASGQADYLDVNEWERLQKILPVADCERLTEDKPAMEVRAFRIPGENSRKVFYAAGEEAREGGYQCIGYGIVDEAAVEDGTNRFVSMKAEQDRENAFYYIGTELDYWNYYPILQRDLPEQVLEYLALQVDILDSSYGSERDVEGGMGGFCAVIPKMDEAARRAYRQILEKHYIQESMYEYRDTVTVDGTDWVEALYLTNSDYGIILIYQEGVRA
ncbi:MAG: hypothetical protein K2L07_07010 [Lachnospiraceae bacterium]|nr:hypothetical protein [Lachnospiraceae bacterium]